MKKYTKNTETECNVAKGFEGYFVMNDGGLTVER